MILKFLHLFFLITSAAFVPPSPKKKPSRDRNNYALLKLYSIEPRSPLEACLFLAYTSPLLFLLYVFLRIVMACCIPRGATKEMNIDSLGFQALFFCLFELSEWGPPLFSFS